MSEWKSYLLKELGEFFGGVTSISKKDYGHGHPFLQYTNVYKNSKVDIGNLELMDVKESDLIKRNCLFGDIFFTASSEVEDEVAMSSVLLDEIENLTYNGFTKRYRLYNFDILSPYYARYLFRARSFRGEVYQRVNGDVRYNISQSSLSEIPIFLPPLEEQHAIASVLSSIDDKIDLLHRQNETLEKMAETLFRQWFVENPNPEWKERPLIEFGQIICGKTPSKKKPEYFDGEYSFIKIPDMHGKTFVFDTQDSLSEEGFLSQKNKALPPKSINVSCIATVGLVTMNAFPSQTNQQINSIIPNDEYRYYLYCEMKNSYDLLHAMASGGTATLNLNTGNFSKTPVLQPDGETIDRFNEFVSPMFDKIFENQTQIRTLTALRDTLLPKLMSGEVRVNYE